MSVLTTQSNNTHIQAIDNKQMPLAPSYVAPQVEQNQIISFTDVLSILNRRKFTILLTLLSILSLVAWYTFSQKPSYRASAIIQIEREGAEIVNFGRTQKSVDGSSSLDDPFFRTRYEMLRGRVVAQKVQDIIPEIQFPGRPGSLPIRQQTPSSPVFYRISGNPKMTGDFLL